METIKYKGVPITLERIKNKELVLPFLTLKDLDNPENDVINFRSNFSYSDEVIKNHIKKILEGKTEINMEYNRQTCVSLANIVYHAKIKNPSIINLVKELEDLLKVGIENYRVINLESSKYKCSLCNNIHNYKELVITNNLTLKCPTCENKE